jgi:solute carrier family 44 (choline transporter-like protein), member 2/4/5
MLFNIIFWVFIGWYSYTVYFAYSEGKPDEIFRPVNGDGKLCGVGELEAYPKLFYVLQKSAPTTARAVCVDTCPREIK